MHLPIVVVENRRDLGLAWLFAERILAVLGTISKIETKSRLFVNAHR